MEKHISIHDDDVGIQRSTCDPERGNAAAMELLVDQKVHAQAECFGSHCRTDHLLFVPHHNICALNAETGERFEVAMEQALPTDFDQTFRTVLCDRPEALPDPGGENDSFHQSLQACSKASRNAVNCASVKAPMLAIRKILFSRLPWPAYMTYPSAFSRSCNL